MAESSAAAGVLVIISGPSGAGKSTVCRKLLERDSKFELSVSATTRPARKGERDGKDYSFLTREEFQRMIREGAFAEYAEYSGNFYGTPRANVDRVLAEGGVLLMDIDTQGMDQVVQQYPQAVTIFLEPPDFDELMQRLAGRNTDSPDERRRRLEIAEREMQTRGRFKYVVTNDDLDATVERIYQIIIGEAQQPSRRN